MGGLVDWASVHGFEFGVGLGLGLIVLRDPFG